MLGIILLVLAALCFLLAAVTETLFGQPPLDLIAWGLLAMTLAALFGGWDPRSLLKRGE